MSSGWNINPPVFGHGSFPFTFQVPCTEPGRTQEMKPNGHEMTAPVPYASSSSEINTLSSSVSRALTLAPIPYTMAIAGGQPLWTMSQWEGDAALPQRPGTLHSYSGQGVSAGTQSAARAPSLVSWRDQGQGAHGGTSSPNVDRRIKEASPDVPSVMAFPRHTPQLGSASREETHSVMVYFVEWIQAPHLLRIRLMLCFRIAQGKPSSSRCA